MSGRPLVVRCGAFGDMVLITALIRDLHAYCSSDVDVVTSGPWSAPLLQGQPGVGEIFTVRSRKMPYWLSVDQHRLVHQLRARGAGPTWFCDGNDAARPLLRRAGIPEDHIVDAKSHPLLRGEHATQQWRRLAKIMPRAYAGALHTAAAEAGAIQADVAGSPGGCCLKVSEGQREDLDAWLAQRRLLSTPLIAVQVGNKRTMRSGFKRLAANHKYWPPERWADVLRHLRTSCPTHAIVLLGTGPEYNLNREIIALAAVDGLHNMADDLAIPRLVALLARADGLITVDSGPAHAAAAVGCPMVVLFGRASTTLYRPWGCAGADVKILTGVVGGEASMLGIETADVVAAWDSLALRSSN